jgi:hypothetical protein
MRPKSYMLGYRIILIPKKTGVRSLQERNPIFAVYCTRAHTLPYVLLMQVHILGGCFVKVRTLLRRV